MQGIVLFMHMCFATKQRMDMNKIPYMTPQSDEMHLAADMNFCSVNVDLPSLTREEEDEL